MHSEEKKREREREREGEKRKKRAGGISLDRLLKKHLYLLSMLSTVESQPDKG